MPPPTVDVVLDNPEKTDTEDNRVTTTARKRTPAKAKAPVDVITETPAEPADLVAFKNRLRRMATRYGEHYGRVPQVVAMLRDIGIDIPDKRQLTYTVEVSSNVDMAELHKEFIEFLEQRTVTVKLDVDRKIN